MNNFSRSASSSNAGIGDVIFVPLTAGIHFSEDNNLAISTMVFAPTGQFRPGNLSNLGMGEWTITPNLAHTYLWKKRGLEFDNFVGFEGRAWGLGPMAFYVAKLEKPGVIVQLRWINEFEVTNLLKGNMLMLGLTLKLN